MSDDKQEQNQPIEGHSYDGIDELDNPLPNWWLATFYITIVFSIGYWAYYHIGQGPTLTQEYEKNIQEVEILQANAKASGPSFSEESLAALVAKPDAVAAGKAVFGARCVACHGAEGGGGIGPNLADAYWIHGNKLVQIAKVINEGVAAKGMPPWGQILKPEELTSVVAYVRSLKGTNPAGAKAPQGDLIQDE